MNAGGFSKKQLAVLSWWCRGSPHYYKDAVICDGAVRSGKTFCAGLSFFLWSMAYFHGQAFGLCGKTARSLGRNLVEPLLPYLKGMGYAVVNRTGQGFLEVSYRGRSNRYYLFGGRDEGSAAHIQGVTLAGVLLDEAALMPRSFVEQALARCSVKGSRFWFTCNPQYPGHWFYREWIERHKEKNALYLRFTMRDNPGLSQEVIRRYETMYSGSFYQRFVLGQWTAVQGAVYPMFREDVHVTEHLPRCARHVISCDYGTVNPASFGLWGEHEGIWYRIKEFYHDSRREGRQLTDEEYYLELERLAGELSVEAVVVDPSAASFLQCIRRHGQFAAIPARNDVADGIRRVSDALQSGKLRFYSGCRDCIREFGLYRWDIGEKDAPVKENDHAMDDVRYFVGYALGAEELGFWIGGIIRG